MTSEQLPSRSENEPRPTWQAFKCPTCGRVESYPPAPAGPKHPRCTWAHNPVTMRPVEVVEVPDA